LELSEVLLILGVFLPCFFVGIWQLNRLNPSKKQPKQAQNSADGSVSELFAVQTEQIKEIIKSKNNQIKSYQQQLRQDQEEQTITPEPTTKGNNVTWEQITELVNLKFPKYKKILPLFKKDIMKEVKGMSREEIIQLISTYTGKSEDSGLDQGEFTENQQDPRPNWA